MAKKLFLAITIALLLLSPLYFSSTEINARQGVGYDDITLYSIADASVNSSSVDTNYGSANSLYVSANSEQDFTYVKFNLTSIPLNANIISATLEIYLSGKGGTIYGFPADIIGAYYCPDNSWSELGITWINKPSFNSNPTGSWAFPIIGLTGYKSWDVNADVKTALTSGILTEVLKFKIKTEDGYALLNSKEGANKPRLYVVYTTQPVFAVNLESAQDTGTTNNLGLIAFSSQKGRYTFSLPTAIDVAAGSYQAKFSGSYKFMRWETSGGISVSDANVANTTVTVSADGTLRALGNVKQLEYTYDREYSIEHAGFYDSQQAGKIDAVRFTPLFSGQLLKARFYIYYTASFASNAFKVHVMDGDRHDVITPFELTPTSKGWLELDLSSYGISVKNGTDFYIGMEWIVNSYPYLGADDTWTVSNRSWSVTGTVWKETSSLTIRAIVGTMCDHTIVADGQVFQITTESNSTLSNLQFTKENKKILINVTDTAGTTGFCNVTIPKQLLAGIFSVTVDGQLTSQVTSYDNGTHMWLYLTYPQNAKTIEIAGSTTIPEFPSLIFLSLFMSCIIIAVAVAEKVKRRTILKLPKALFT
jgi:hypothetical protein